MGNHIFSVIDEIIEIIEGTNTRYINSRWWLVNHICKRRGGRAKGVIGCLTMLKENLVFNLVKLAGTISNLVFLLAHQQLFQSKIVRPPKNYFPFQLNSIGNTPIRTSCQPPAPAGFRNGPRLYSLHPNNSQNVACITHIVSLFQPPPPPPPPPGTASRATAISSFSTI